MEIRKTGGLKIEIIATGENLYNYRNRQVYTEKKRKYVFL